MKPVPMLLALAACAPIAAVIEPELAQLARFQSAPAEVVALQPVHQPCPAENPACPRLHQLRAEACLALALHARAPGAACPSDAEATRRQLDCAAQSYAAALAGAEPPLHPPLQAGLAQALLCRADLSGADPAALAQQAASAAAAATPEAAPLLAARAALLLARLGPAATRCAAAHRAATLATGDTEALARAQTEAQRRIALCEATP